MTLLPSSREARGLRDGNITLLLRVVKPQPVRRGDEWCVETKPRAGFSSEKTMRSILPIYAPWHVGDIVAVKETWAVRTYVRVVSVACQRITDLTRAAIDAADIPPVHQPVYTNDSYQRAKDLEAYWTQLHGPEAMTLWIWAIGVEKI